MGDDRATRADDHADISNLLARYCLLLDHDDVVVRTRDGWRFASRRCRFMVAPSAS
jgi:hypothetical protein